MKHDAVTDKLFFFQKLRRYFSVHATNLFQAIASGLFCKVLVAMGLAILTLAPALANFSQERVSSTALVVGSEENSSPFAAELWEAVAKEVGLEYSVRVLPFHQLLQEFKDGKIDVFLHLAISDERRLFADFAVPHATVQSAIFVRDNHPSIHSDKDLAGKSIIVLKPDLEHEYAETKGWSVRLVSVDTAEVGMRLLASGQHDAMLLGRVAGLQTIQRHGLTGIQALSIQATLSQKFAFATGRGRPDLLAQINEGLALTKVNGSYEQLYEKWFGVHETRKLKFVDLLIFIGPTLVFLRLVWDTSTTEGKWRGMLRR